MKKIFFILSIFLVVISIAGCKSENKKSADGNGGIYKSSDAGETFHLSSVVNLEKNLSNVSILDIAIDAMDPKIIYVATANQGIYRSVNGGQSWAESKSEFTFVRKITLDPVNKNILYIVAEKDGERALFKTTDGGVNWKKLLSQRTKETPMYLDIVIDPKHPSILYATDSSGGLFKSINSGESWSSVYWEKNPIKKVILDQNNDQKIYLLTSSDEILTSDDAGETFELSVSEYGFGTIYSVAISKIKPGIFYVLSKNGLQITKDGGKTYQKMKTLLPPNNTVAHQIVLDPIDESILYLVSGKVIYKTTNNGDSWQSIPLKINWPVKAFVIDHKNSNNIYIGLSKPPKTKNNLFPF